MNLANVVSQTEQAVNCGVFMPVPVENFDGTTDWQRSIILYIDKKEQVKVVLPISANYDFINDSNRKDAKEANYFWMFQPVELTEDKVTALKDDDNLYFIHFEANNMHECRVSTIQGIDIRSLLITNIESAIEPTKEGIYQMNKTIPSLRKKFFQGR